MLISCRREIQVRPHTPTCGNCPSFPSNPPLPTARPSSYAVRTREERALEARADLEALGRRQRHHRLGQLRLECVVVCVVCEEGEEEKGVNQPINQSTKSSTSLPNPLQTQRCCHPLTSSLSKTGEPRPAGTFRAMHSTTPACQ